jgi:hypothetical protein
MEGGLAMKIEHNKVFLALVETLENTPHKKLVEYFNITLLAATFIIAGSLYYIRSTSNELLLRIDNARHSTARAEDLIAQHHQQAKRNEYVANNLESNDSYDDLKSYFERFCKEQKVTPGPGWVESFHVAEDSQSSRFEVEELAAEFKFKQTQEMVELLDALEKDDLISLKESSMTFDGSQLLFKINIFTRRFRQALV